MTKIKLRLENDMTMSERVKEIFENRDKITVQNYIIMLMVSVRDMINAPNIQSRVTSICALFIYLRGIEIQYDSEFKKDTDFKMVIDWAETSLKCFTKIAKNELYEILQDNGKVDNFIMESLDIVIEVSSDKSKGEFIFRTPQTRIEILLNDYIAGNYETGKENDGTTL